MSQFVARNKGENGCENDLYYDVDGMHSSFLPKGIVLSTFGAPMNKSKGLPLPLLKQNVSRSLLSQREREEKLLFIH